MQLYKGVHLGFGVFLGWGSLWIRGGIMLSGEVRELWWTEVLKVRVYSLFDCFSGLGGHSRFVTWNSRKVKQLDTDLVWTDPQSWGPKRKGPFSHKKPGQWKTLANRASWNIFKPAEWIQMGRYGQFPRAFFWFCLPVLFWCIGKCDRSFLQRFVAPAAIPTFESQTSFGHDC